MNCPACNTTLQMTERQGVEVDYCPSCRGVWLDRGELDKIIERAARELAPVAAPPRAAEPRYAERPPERYYERERRDYDRDHRRYDDDYRKRKKRSFLDDIFDFD